MQVGGQPIGGGGSPRPLAGFMRQGNTNIPLGGVGRSAHQMTSHPSIDFFIVVPVALLTVGN